MSSTSLLPRFVTSSCLIVSSDLLPEVVSCPFTTDPSKSISCPSIVLLLLVLLNLGYYLYTKITTLLITCKIIITNITINNTAIIITVKCRCIMLVNCL
ncbi:MAG: hypothetical protein [crAssphage sp. isolate ctcc615]|uniref:Uncharacterized protein n=1 Tax=crAssphage sp. isolate ctcc615 TaxID=2989853 RepID=A0A345BNZ7_9CAUD|nr:MAG: hypothetical protein KNU00_gp55 [crAssphage sp. isolate ctcc615]AXF52168.1 MAG: hypothetical protein [crAssphage sp. isolate ctcc615]